MLAGIEVQAAEAYRGHQRRSEQRRDDDPTVMKPAESGRHDSSPKRTHESCPMITLDNK